MKTRILISAGFVAVAATTLFTAPAKGPSGFITDYFASAVVAVMSAAAVLEVKEWLAKRAARRSEDQDATDRSVGIAILRSEDGESR